MWKPAFLQPKQVPRTNIASNPSIKWGDGIALQEFFTPDSEWFGREVCPPDNKWTDGSPSFMAPISHYHLFQREMFRVERGSGLWYLGGKAHRLDVGDEITIPVCRPHRFENLPGSKEPLQIVYRYDPFCFDMMESFFRNTLTYLDDCRKAKTEPSPLQLCVFLAAAYMPGDLIPCPGPDYLRCFVNTVFMLVMAFIGRFVYGYKASYLEYYDPAISRRHVLERAKRSKKGK